MRTTAPGDGLAVPEPMAPLPRGARGAKGRQIACALAAGLLSTACAPVAALAAPSDGRVYEQVSPVEKHGNEAGTRSGQAPTYSVATADGSAVMYQEGGPQGEHDSGLPSLAVARRTSDGWRARSALPRPGREGFDFRWAPRRVLPSADLSRLLFYNEQPWLADVPTAVFEYSPALYLGGPAEPLSWITRPTIANPTPTLPTSDPDYGFMPAGASADLRRIYFSYWGTLLPEDDPRTPLATMASPRARGFYEYTDGQLKPAGVLPNGTLDPAGAMAAAATASTAAPNLLTTAEFFDNQVSADGRRAFFVSPDPRAASGRPSELYVRKDGETTSLVSRSELTGLAAPGGARPATQPHSPGGRPSYAYGARDGSSVIFRAVDRLTADAPDDGTTKAYRYDVDADDVVYLPGVSGSVLAGADDLSRFIFVDSANSAIWLWDQGAVTKVTDGSGPFAAARSTPDGTVFVFATASVIPGLNASGLTQIYRYDVAGGQLDCVSCPAGGDPASDATLTPNSDALADWNVVTTRGMSRDGGRVFFDTQDALVGQDVNGQRDVYEWRPDGVRLISSGRSPEPSFFLDNSESGDSVFFTTTEALGSADRDGAYDVYDARVGGGFAEPAPPVRCSDDCQGAAPPPPPATSPETGSYTGAGNLTPEPGQRAPGGQGAKVRLLDVTVDGATAKLSLRAPAKGRLSVTGSGVRRVKRTVSRAGSYTATVRLSAGARRTLRRRGSLTRRLRVGWTPAEGATSSTTVAVTFER